MAAPNNRMLRKNFRYAQIFRKCGRYEHQDDGTRSYRN